MRKCTQNYANALQCTKRGVHFPIKRRFLLSPLAQATTVQGPDTRGAAARERGALLAGVVVSSWAI